MRGTVRKVSLPRRVVIDLMRASAGVPFVAVRRTLDDRTAVPRTKGPEPPGWAVIFAKAFAILARNNPSCAGLSEVAVAAFLRISATVAMIASTRATPDGVLLFPSRRRI